MNLEEKKKKYNYYNSYCMDAIGMAITLLPDGVFNVKRHPREKYCRWIKPNLKYISLKTNCVVENSQVGYGSLFRDEQGRAIKAYMGCTRIQHIAWNEMWDIFQGIKLANKCGLKKIQLGSDSLLAVDVIKGKWQCPWRILCLLHQIWHEATFIDEFEMKHTWREAKQTTELFVSGNYG